VAVGLQSQTSKTTKKVARSKSETMVQELPPEEATTIVPSHVTGKPAEREPEERGAQSREEPEAASRRSEGLDAGYSRCTESSDFANRGRDRS
jgi:hypothetical protein